MLDQKTKSWLKKAQEMGLSDMEIQDHLRKAGWDHDDINRLLVQGYAPLAGSTVLIEHALSLPSFQELIKQAWLRIYKHRKQYFIISLLFTGIGVFLYFFSSLLLNGIYFGLGMLGSDSFSSNPFLSFTSGVGFGLVYSIFMWVLESFLFAWIQATFITMLTTTTEKFVLGELMITSLRKVPPYWWITLLTMALIGGASYLLIIPGVIFSVWFSFAIFMPALEKTHGMMALLKSKEYFRGIWGQTLRRYAALYGVMAIIIITLFIGLWIIGAIGIAAIGYPALILPIIIVFTIATVLLCVLFIPFALSYTYTLYQSIRKLKKNTEINPFMSSKGGLIATAVSGWIALPVIIIAVIGLTSGFYSDLTAESRNATRQADIYTIHNALKLYYEDNELYPQRLSTLTAGYIELLPADPDTYAPYTYLVNNMNDTYSICASLEPTENVNEQIFCLDQEGTRLIE